jgi:hypothetical protein
MAGILVANVVVGAVAFKGTIVGSNVAQCESLMMRRVTGTPVRLKGKAFKVCVRRRIVLSLDALTIIPCDQSLLFVCGSEGTIGSFFAGCGYC